MDFKNGLWLICLVNRRMFDLITMLRCMLDQELCRQRRGTVPFVPWPFVRSHHFVVANLSDSTPSLLEFALRPECAVNEDSQNFILQTNDVSWSGL